MAVGNFYMSIRSDAYYQIFYINNIDRQAQKFEKIDRGVYKKVPGQRVPGAFLTIGCDYIHLLFFNYIAFFI